MKKGVKFIFVFALAILLCASFVSAGWFGDFFGKITGNAVGASEDTVCKVSGYVYDYDLKKCIPQKSSTNPVNPNDRNGGFDQCSYVTDSMKQKYSNLLDGAKLRVDSISDAKTRYGLENFKFENPPEYFCDHNPDGSVCIGNLVSITGPTNCDGNVWIRLNVEDPECFVSTGGPGILLDDSELLESPEDSAGNYELVTNCDVLALGNSQGNLYNFDLNDLSFEEKSLGPRSISFSPVSYGEKTYVVSEEILLALDSEGNKVWEYRFDGSFSGATGNAGVFYQPFIDEGLEVLYVGTSEGFLVAINLKASVSEPIEKWVADLKTSSSKLDVKGNYLLWGMEMLALQS